jgi:outer membrane protein TolC
MSEQYGEQVRVERNAVKLRFRLGGITTVEVIEAQNFLDAQEKELQRARKARQDDVLPSEDELRRRFHLDDPEPGGEA